MPCIESSPKTSNVAGDTRGAIMVMGVFLCLLVAASLWYLSGLGEAIVYRERTQEAADAVAFTIAAAHAKGMNVLVLLNLTMALILSIRVALKALLTVEIIAEVVFGLACLDPFGGEVLCAAAPIVGDAIEVTTNLINETRQPINDALKGLHDAERVIAKVVPTAAVAASLDVGHKYQGLVTTAVGMSQPELMPSLPVTDGSPDYLCDQAGAAIGELLAGIFDSIGLSGLGAAADWIGSRIGGIAAAAPQWFCEFPGASPPSPANNPDLQNAAKSTCKNLAGNKGADGGTLTSDQQSLYDSYVTKGKFDESKCEKDQMSKAQQKVNAKSGGNPSASDVSSMTTVMLVPDYGNGCSANESIGVAMGNQSKISKAPKIVQVGNFGKGGQSSSSLSVSDIAGTIADSGAVPDGFTQAEFFFDCAGPWGQNACNGDGESAMWSFHWRPRLILFDNTHELFKVAAEGLARMYQAQMESDLLSSLGGSLRNVALREELQKDIAGGTAVYAH
jgi:hypothetical protein